MTQKEATEIVINYLTPTFKEYGYEYKKSWYGFIKKEDDGFDRFTLSFLNYYTSQQPFYNFMKRFNIVENINKELSDKFNLNNANSEKDDTFWFNYESLNNLHTNGYLPDVETEIEMIENAKKIKEFSLEVGFPMLEKYKTLQAIDSEINGDDFWPTDWMHKFTLGGGFLFKRTIIAHLCANENLEKIKELHIKRWTDVIEEQPTCAKLIEAYNYLNDVLLKDVKPIAGI